LAKALAADSVTEIFLEEAIGKAAGLSRLRDEAFDAVLVSHEPGEIDAVELIEGYRAGGADEPMVVLGTQSEQEMTALCFEAGADGYVCVNTTTTRTLIWVVARAVQRQQLTRENRRMSQAERQRQQREHGEAERLLAQQRALIEEPRSSGTNSPSPTADLRTPSGLPVELANHYRELLRTYVIMGSGTLAGELTQLADLLATAGITAQQTMLLHVHVLEELVRGLGARSTRHVMTRADLLVMELMMHLAENFRNRYLGRVRPPVQQLLPGFQDDLTAF
jgi:DNA-binding NarL/FixJ family response regulator